MKPCKNCIHHTACVTANPDMVKKTFECEHFEDKEKIKSALEKQIPKKVKKTAEYLNGAGEWEAEYECVTCGNPYIDDSYCSCCGQALDWSEEE